MNPADASIRPPEPCADAGSRHPCHQFRLNPIRIDILSETD
jgi:hypothetical protein